ncbi:hypothetical protein HAX54_023460 [Datura stramonium]|uniref:Uncharacterized protein n=1 Tax=Datura stramonium TaxID=4076 RepID=A0ABS8S4Q1_DATST|nr:hypothetical protein [Datura stramonium]
MAASRKVRVREKRDERQRGPQREESWWPERRLGGLSVVTVHGWRKERRGPTLMEVGRVRWLEMEILVVRQCCFAGEESFYMGSGH